MGSSESKRGVKIEDVVKELDYDELERTKLLGRLEKQLEELKDEVTTVQPVLNKNVRQTVNQDQDAVLLRYSQLQDKERMTDDIKSIFGGYPLLDFLLETATKMLTTMTASAELREILRWQERTIVKRVGNKVYGMEVHYKVKILEECKGTVFKSKDTVVLIAYKFIAHAMDLNPEDFPDDEEHKKLTF